MWLSVRGAVRKSVLRAAFSFSTPFRAPTAIRSFGGQVFRVGYDLIPRSADEDPWRSRRAAAGRAVRRALRREVDGEGTHMKDFCPYTPLAEIRCGILDIPEFKIRFARFPVSNSPPLIYPRLLFLLQPRLGFCVSVTDVPSRVASIALRRSTPVTGIPLSGRLSSSCPR